MSEIPPPTIPPATPPPPGGGSYTPPPPPPPPGGGYGPGPSGSSDRTLMVVLSYLGLLSLIPYLTKKEDPETHWHAKNGLGLFIVEVLIWVLFFVIGIVLRDSVASCGTGIIQCVLWLALLGLHIYCIIQAVGGKRPNIPGITDFAQKTL